MSNIYSYLTYAFGKCFSLKQLSMLGVQPHNLCVANQQRNKNRELHIISHYLLFFQVYILTDQYLRAFIWTQNKHPSKANSTTVVKLNSSFCNRCCLSLKYHFGIVTWQSFGNHRVFMSPLPPHTHTFVTFTCTFTDKNTNIHTTLQTNTHVRWLSVYLQF